MKVFFTFAILLCFFHAFAMASTSLSDDAILARLDAIDTSLIYLRTSLEDHKTNSDTKEEVKYALYDSQIVSLREKASVLEMQLKIIWGVLGIGTIGGGSIYGGMKVQQRKNGSNKTT